LRILRHLRQNQQNEESLRQSRRPYGGERPRRRMALVCWLKFGIFRRHLASLAEFVWMVPPLRGGIAWGNDPWVRSFLAHPTAMVVLSLRDGGG
jgi:hypothetical protein